MMLPLAKPFNGTDLCCQRHETDCSHRVSILKWRTFIQEVQADRIVLNTQRQDVGVPIIEEIFPDNEAGTP